MLWLTLALTAALGGTALVSPASTGPALSDTALPAQPSTADNPRLIEMGDRMALLWRADARDQLWMQVLDRDGRPMGPPSPLVTMTRPELSVTEGRFDAAYANGKLLVAFQALGVYTLTANADGKVTRTPELVSRDTQRGYPTVSAHPGGFEVITTTQRAARSGSDLMAYSFDSSGKPSGSERRLTSTGTAFNPVAEWHNGQHTVVYRQDVKDERGLRHAELFTLSLPASGSPGAPRALTTDDGRPSDDPEIFTIGGQQAVLWVDYGQASTARGMTVTGQPHLRVAPLTGGSTPGQQFTDPSQFNADPAQVSASGSAAWITGSNQDTPMKVYTHKLTLSGSGFTVMSLPPLGDGRDEAKTPTVATLPSGDPLVIWADTRGDFLTQLRQGR